nr:unnamed protein product [Spirometra erinaceieuropaei]
MIRAAILLALITSVFGAGDFETMPNSSFVYLEPFAQRPQSITVGGQTVAEGSLSNPCKVGISCWQPLTDKQFSYLSVGPENGTGIIILIPAAGIRLPTAVIVRRIGENLQVPPMPVVAGRIINLDINTTAERGIILLYNEDVKDTIVGGHMHKSNDVGPPDGKHLLHIPSRTPTYGLAKWLFRRLQFLIAESDTTVSSSAQFLEKLKWDLAIETNELLLQSKYDETENRLEHAQILQLLKLCLRTYFTFDGTIYEQVKCTPMGSPISGFIAEAVLQRLESLVFQHHRPKFWARYVDDTFVVIERNQVLTFKEHLNSVFPDIQFTMKKKEENLLAFLHVLVCRIDCGGLKTKVFRKAKNKMQALNFNKNHPISHNRSCVRTLCGRVETHCIESEHKIAELKYLRRVSKANGYPRNLVNRLSDVRPRRTDTKSWRVLPYVKNASVAVGRLAPLGVGVAHRPEATITCLVMKTKDPLPRL